MRHLPSLVALRTFEAAARQQSFKRAAADLGVTPTAVSHQIRQLETELGSSLFKRRPREVTLTPVGRAFFLDLQQAFDAIAAAVDRMHGALDRRQAATLAAPDAFTAAVLVPRLAAFRARCPGWDLRLQILDESDILDAGAADAAIRHGADAHPGLVTTPLLTDRFAPVCSPHIGVQRPRHLATATLIHCPQAPSWRRWLEQRGKGRFDPDAGLVCVDQASAISAALAGRGVALASLLLVARDLESGALIQPFGPTLDGSRYDLVHPVGAEDRPAVSVLKQWLLDEFAPVDARAATPVQ